MRILIATPIPPALMRRARSGGCSMRSSSGSPSATRSPSPPSPARRSSTCGPSTGSSRAEWTSTSRGGSSPRVPSAGAVAAASPAAGCAAASRGAPCGSGSRGSSGILDELLASRRFDLVAVEDNAIGGAYRFGAASADGADRARGTPAAPVQVVCRLLERAGPWAPRRAGLAPLAGLSAGDLAPLRPHPGVHAARRRGDRGNRSRAGRPCPRQPVRRRVAAALDPAPDSSRELVFIGNFSHAPNVDGALWLGGEIMPILRSTSPASASRSSGPGRRARCGRSRPPTSRVTGLVEDTPPYLSRRRSCSRRCGSAAGCA